jgi:hypothetical protein
LEAAVLQTLTGRQKIPEVTVIEIEIVKIMQGILQQIANIRKNQQ